MPLIDITNPDIIKFLIENYDKTSRLRLKWNKLHAEKLKEAATLQREEKGYYEKDVLEHAMCEGMATITRDYKNSTVNRRVQPIRDGTHVPGIKDLKKGHSISDVGLGDPIDDPRLTRLETDLSVDPVMRPVEPNEHQIIYDSIPNYGRVVYLKTRSRRIPEKKYYLCACSGWEYGWRLRDSYFNKHAPSYGRVWRLTRDVKSRSGPQPDPKHYIQSDTPVTKCLL